MMRRAAAARLCAAGFAVLLGACATVPQPPPERPGDVLRTGRLALSVQDQPGRSFSAGFELRGQPASGTLTLLSPIGSTVAVLRWRPGIATLEAQGREPRQFPSVDAMVEEATGAAVPVAALFDWLSGVATPVPGWEPDLSALPEGRLRARRLQPPPTADLRVLLDPS